MNKDKPVDKIIEGNKAIAEFVGGRLKYYNLSNEPYYQLNKQQWMPERLVYHTSWDWLMPAWYKFYHEVTLSEWYQDFTDEESSKQLDCMEYSLQSANLPAAHKHFVNLLKWYNQTKNK